MFKKLWVDDVRPPPDESWDVATSFHKAICMLEETEYYIVSLDHDLGCFYGNREMTGDDVLQYLIMRKLEGLPSPKTVTVHSMNSVKSPNMKKDIERYFRNL